MATLFLDHSPNVFAAVITLATCACIVFPLRVYVRLSNKGAWGYDDWSMVIGFIPFAGLTVACLGGSFHGIGVHQDRMTDEEMVDGRKWFFLFEVFFCVAIIFIKLSISFMLARIVNPVKAYVYALWTASALVTVANVVALFYIVFQCNPVSYAWDQRGDGSCLPSYGLANVYYVDTAINIAVDWLCAFMPIPLLWNMQMDRKSKISVCVLLSLGVLASLAACIRLKYTVRLNNSDDFLYAIGDVVIWGYAENAMGMIVGCISTLRPLFRKAFGGFRVKESHDIKLSGMSGRVEQSGGQASSGRSKAEQSIVKSVQVRQEFGRLTTESEEELVMEAKRGFRVP